MKGEVSILITKSFTVGGFQTYVPPCMLSIRDKLYYQLRTSYTINYRLAMLSSADKLCYQYQFLKSKCSAELRMRGLSDEIAFKVHVLVPAKDSHSGCAA